MVKDFLVRLIFSTKVLVSLSTCAFDGFVLNINIV